MISFWKFFLENKSFTYFLVILTLLAGFYSVNKLPKESTPEITIPIAVISTPFFGATAFDVESLVTEKIENVISNLSKVKKYTSSSASGISTIVVEFEQGADIDERVTRLKEKVDGVRGDLPIDGNDSSITKIEFSEQPVLTISLVSELPYYSLNQTLDILEKRIEKIDGVADFRFFGIPEREITIVTENKNLLEKGVSFISVASALGGANNSQPVGSLKIGFVDYPLDLKSEINTFDQLKNIPIGQAGVSSLVLTDVANIYNGYKKKDIISEVGEPGKLVLNSVTIQVLKKNGGDITKITKNVIDEIDSLKDDLLIGIDYKVTYDAGEVINRELTDLTKNGLRTVSLVFLMLLLFIGFRESIIAASSIPFSFLMAFIVFMIAGNTINFISLFSFILAIGILVDTAIVVVEGINSKIALGRKRDAAAIETIKEFGIPLIAGTFTTVAVFFPLLFLSGITGQFIRGIPVTVISVILSSLFVSLAFVTVFCSTFLKNKHAVSVKKETFVEKMFNKFKVFYKRIIGYLLDRSLPRRLFEILITITFFASLGLVATGLVKNEFFPGGDLEYAYIAIELAPGTPIEDTYFYVKQVEDLLQDKEYIDSFVSTSGRTSQYEEEQVTAENFANIILNIKEEFQARGISLVDPLIKELKEKKLFDAEIIAGSGGPPTGAPIDVNLSSEDSKLLNENARSLEKYLLEKENLLDVTSSLSGNNSGFDIFIDRNAIFRFNVSLQDIISSIKGITNGLELFDITENNEDITVVIKNNITNSVGIKDTKNITPEMLNNVSIKNQRGEDILLGSIIDIKLAETSPIIERKDGERVVNLTAKVREGFNPTDSRKEVEEYLKENLDTFVSYSFGGEAQEQESANTEMFIALLAGLFLMFSILILQFGRWRQVLIVMSVIPYGLAGVLIGLFISGNALSFPSMLGFIGLTGIVVNNSIILISVFNQYRKENPDWSIEKVVIEGSASRLRPIILTSFTTIIGVMPLLTSSAIWAPIGYSMIFGLLFCVFVTLVLVPLLYRRLEGFSSKTKRFVFDWYLTIFVVFILPIFILILFSIIGSKIGNNQIFFILGLVLSILVMYFFTHKRKHHQ